MSKLIPEEELKKIPPFYATEEMTDPLAHVKLFTPDAAWSWYITEYDEMQRECFGLVDGMEMELGYFSLEELENLRGPLGLAVERDLYFQPTKLSVLRAEAVW